MNDIELGAIVNSLEADSVSYNSEFMSQNEEYLRRYNQEPYGDEEDGYSKVIASDVFDLVEADISSLIRVFQGSGNIFEFEPYSDDPEAIAEAEAKTKYINHLVQHREDSYKINHDFLKDAEIQKMGVMHYYMDTIEDTRVIKEKASSMPSLTLKIDKLKDEDDVTSVTIIEKEEEEDGSLEVRLRITTKIKVVKIQNIPTEDFLISKNSASPDSASMVGHVSYPTRSDLVMSGLSEERVSEFPVNSGALGGDYSQRDSSKGSDQSETMKAIRFRDEGGNVTDGKAYSEWAGQPVRMVVMYAKIDFDRDGIAERRRIVKIGNDITENEPYDHVPYAIGSCILEPHKAIGNGRASLVVADQSVNTALDRALLDNTYAASRPRRLLGDGVNHDDYLDHRSDGIVRMKPNSQFAPRDSVVDLVEPYIGQGILMTQQQRSQQQAKRTGTILDSQGLEADQLHQETATRFNGIERASEAKIELVARNLAETAYRKLYEGIAWTVMRFQDKPTTIMVSGRPLEVDPSNWKNPTLAVSQVGLGAGTGMKVVEQMQGLLSIQGMLKQQGSLLVDDQKTFNTLNKMIMGLGLARTSDYFNDPSQPQELILAQNEQLMAALQQSQLMIEQLQQSNPLAEAEMIRAQASLQNANSKSQVEMIKADAQREIKEIELLQKGTQFQAGLTKDYSEMELKYGVDIPGQGMDGLASRSTEELIEMLSQGV